MGIYEPLFPKDRDIYAVSEIASHVCGIPVREVTMQHMKMAVKLMRLTEEIHPIVDRNGAYKQFKWPLGRRAFSLYSVRNHERYTDCHAAIDHIRESGAKEPEQNQQAQAKIAGLARKKVEFQERLDRTYGRVGKTK